MEAKSSPSTEELTNRLREIKKILRKTHFCGYHFRQRCLRFAEDCPHAHGFSDMKRIDSKLMGDLKMEMFNIR